MKLNTVLLTVSLALAAALGLFQCVANVGMEQLSRSCLQCNRATAL
jgi:hypothetical protein